MVVSLLLQFILNTNALEQVPAIAKKESKIIVYFNCENRSQPIYSQKIRYFSHSPKPLMEDFAVSVDDSTTKKVNPTGVNAIEEIMKFIQYTCNIEDRNYLRSMENLKKFNVKIKQKSKVLPLIRYSRSKPYDLDISEYLDSLKISKDNCDTPPMVPPRDDQDLVQEDSVMPTIPLAQITLVGNIDELKKEMEALKVELTSTVLKKNETQEQLAKMTKSYHEERDFSQKIIEKNKEYAGAFENQKNLIEHLSKMYNQLEVDYNNYTQASIALITHYAKLLSDASQDIQSLVAPKKTLFGMDEKKQRDKIFKQFEDKKGSVYDRYENLNSSDSEISYKTKLENFSQAKSILLAQLKNINMTTQEGMDLQVDFTHNPERPSFQQSSAKSDLAPATTFIPAPPAPPAPQNLLSKGKEEMFSHSNNETRNNKTITSSALEQGASKLKKVDKMEKQGNMTTIKDGDSLESIMARAMEKRRARTILDEVTNDEDNNDFDN